MPVKRVDKRHHGMNVSLRELTDNMRSNNPLAAERGLVGMIEPSVLKPQDTPVALIGGGPSINSYVPVIKTHQQHKTEIFTVNGSHDWALRNGITPTHMVMVDARPENVRFVQTPVIGCSYWMATQVHPDVIAKIPRNQLAFWINAASPEVMHWCNKEGYSRRDCLVHGAIPPITGGSTVTLRALPLLYYRGYRRVGVFGLDCSFDDSSHAYDQLPDGEIVKVRGERGRVFRTTQWMLLQAQDFFRTMKCYPQMSVALFGDTLLSNMVLRRQTLPNVRVFK